MIPPPDLSSTGQFIAWRARHDPERTAVVEFGTRIAYRALALDLMRAVRALQDMRIGPGLLVDSRSRTGINIWCCCWPASWSGRRRRL